MTRFLDTATGLAALVLGMLLVAFIFHAGVRHMNDVRDLRDNARAAVVLLERAAARLDEQPTCDELTADAWLFSDDAVCACFTEVRW